LPRYYCLHIRCTHSIHSGINAAAARLVFQSSRYDHITLLLYRLHWLRAPERIAYNWPCWSTSVSMDLRQPTWLTLQPVAGLPGRRQRLRSSSISAPAVPLTCLSMIGDRAFPVAAAKHGTVCHQKWRLRTFKTELKTHLFFPPIHYWLYKVTAVLLAFFFAENCIALYMYARVLTLVCVRLHVQMDRIWPKPTLTGHGKDSRSMTSLSVLIFSDRFMEYEYLIVDLNNKLHSNVRQLFIIYY